MLSIAGLLSTLVVIWRFILPAILGGADPLLICIVGATVIMAITLIAGHGGGRTSLVALAATAACLVLAGLLATWAMAFTTLIGAASKEATSLIRLSGGVNMRGLLLGAIIVGAVGVPDDVTTTQASTVFQLHEADRTLSRRELYRRSMRVGRDHIAATTNTLLLAYAGASLPLLLLLAGQGLALGVLSFEVLATEDVRTLIGSAAIIAAIPIASVIAAFAVRPEPRRR